jgi:4,5-DOPA dioxygenase extradiol
MGSGNTVHNLRAMIRSAPNSEAFDWNKRFDDWVANCIETDQLEQLTQFQSLGTDAVLAHPSYEHFLPLLCTAGAVDESDQFEYFNDTYQAKSVAMRSVIWY